MSKKRKSSTKLETLAEATAPATTLPDGYVWKLWGRDGKNTTAGTMVVTRNGERALVVENARHPMPITREALEQAFASYTYTITDVDGNEYKLSGVEAAAAAKFLHAAESVRGYGRKEGTTAAQVRDALEAFTTVGGSFRSGTKQVSEDEIEGLTAAEMKELLRARGLLRA